MNYSKIIIEQSWGGLGDNLQFSMLPEICKNNNIKCYISKNNKYRNDEIKNFVWGKNPYIDGEIENNILFDFNKLYSYGDKVYNVVEAIQMYYGFKNVCHYPKIYYTPNKIENLENKTLVDLSIFSIAAEYDKNKLTQIIKNFNLNPDKTLSVELPNVKYPTFFKISKDIKTIKINSLEEYADAIYSCERFITLYSGQACLASTIKHQTQKNSLDINVITLDRFLPKNNPIGFVFKNTNYIA
jgi:hypothetical protein